MILVVYLIDQHFHLKQISDGYFQSVANNPLPLSAERWQAFLESLYL